MLEPRYPPTAAAAPRMLEPTAPHDLDAAVDLSRKSANEAKAAAAAAMAAAAAAAAAANAEAARAREDSDDDAPLDLKVRPSASPSTKPAFPGLNLPGPQQRAELLRIAELYTSGPPANSTPLPPTSRESSQERDGDACEFCGADSRGSDFVASDHRDGACNRGSIACTLCAKTFTLYSHYEAHKKCHQKLKQRQYPCQTCGKIFTSASNRNMHQRIHKGVRPFQCAPCGVFFRQKAHLQKHQKTQGHIQASELYEKKKREGTLNGNGEATNNNTTAPPTATATATATADTILKREGDQESLQSSEDGHSSNSEPVVDSSSGSVGARRHTPPAIAADSSSPEDETSPSSSSNGRGGRSRFKSSPKRKQSRPQYHSPEEEEEDEEEKYGGGGGIDDEDERRQEKIRSFVDYNDLTHGYECRQCAFSSHDLSVLKSHVSDEHLSSTGGVYKCRECQIAFRKEFNLRIHNRKHETSSQFLPCDHCEQVFKVPNKLIKHMEGVHSVCPNCGDRQEDKAGLLRHLEDAHGDLQKKGFHANLVQFTPLNSMKSPQPAADTSRAAKMRKVDSLAEVIRQKQLQNHATSTINGNEPNKSPLTSPGMPRRRKNDMSAVKALLAAAAVTEVAACKPIATDLPMNNDAVHDLLRKGENNNILSSLKLPPTVRLPTQPVGMSPPPPSSPPPPHPHAPLPPHLLPSVPTLPPPPPALHPSSVVGPGQQIRGEVSVTIVPTRPMSDDSEEENGLDLSMSKSRRDDEDENHVSTTAKDEVHTNGSVRLPLGAPAPPFPPFPFFGGLLPPVPPGADPALTEHLMKLTAANLPPSHPAAAAPPPCTVLPGPSDLSAAKAPPPPPSAATSSLPPTAAVSHPYTVLSAMLGQPAYQPMFPGMPNSIFPKQNGTSPAPLPAAAAGSAIPSAPTTVVPPGAELPKEPAAPAPSLESKPFRCTYCHKEFSHLTSLESHLEHMHSGDSKHMCDICGKNFSSKSNLTAHKKIHSGERPFECAVCHKRFRQKAHLQKHETTHSSATPYKCTVCDKAFGHPSNLNTHMATHSNVRPYHCTDCGKSYKDSASFKRHRLQHTGERPYPCSLCTEAFIDSKSLRRHREVAHPNALPDPELDSVGGEDDEEDEVDDEMQEDEEDQGNESMLQSSSSSLGSDRDISAANASTSSAYSSFESHEGDKEVEDEKEIKVDDDEEEEEDVDDEEKEVVNEMEEDDDEEAAKENGEDKADSS